ncbi:MAG: F0F1 ATP synthase subunit B [Phycisphaerales bacterium]
MQFMHMLILALDDAHTATGGDVTHGAEHAQVFDPSNWLPAVTALIVFGVAFAILALKVWPMITQALDARDQKIRDEIRAAEEAREQAKAALDRYENELSSAREEASRMIQQARAEAKATAEELRARNEVELADLRNRAANDIRAAKENAIAEIHAEAGTLATAIASRILKREISVQDQQRLVEESLGQLGSGRL